MPSTPEPPSVPSATSSVHAGWHPDPLDRFDLRYHNGAAWTADVSSAGDRFVDPLGIAPTVASDGSEPTSRATAAMVLGIVAICIGWFPYVAVAGLLCALAAISLGVTARRRAEAPGSTAASRARIGITTGLVGLLVAVLGLVFTVIIDRALDRYANPADNEATVTACAVDDGVVTAEGELTNLADSTADFTVRIVVMRPGTDNVHRTATVELDDVPPGATEAFELQVEVALDQVECAVHDVDGPLPFGVDIPT